MPKEIKFILKKLNSRGFKAYIVGGAVRDMILSKEPYDYDITTSAKPEDIIEIFKEYIITDIGKKYGTIVLRIKNYDVEITTFRIEGSYEKNRKPQNIVFTESLEEDLKRRDFTINAMATDGEELIDILCGQKDIDNKIIRAIGNPDKRIEEDALRILRAIRFAGQLGFKIEDNLYQAIANKKNLLKNLSGDRIKNEFNKILLLNKPSISLKIMAETGVLGEIIPKLQLAYNFNQDSPYHENFLLDHILCVVDNVDKNLILRYAALFHDIGKIDTKTMDGSVAHYYGHEEVGAHEAEKIMKYFNLSNDFISRVVILVKNHMKAHEVMTDKALRRQIRRVGRENILMLYDLMIADRICTIEGRDVGFLLDRKNRVTYLMENDETTEKNFLKIDGNDIIKCGIKEGKQIGIILKEMEEIVMDSPFLNDRNKLIEIVKDRYRS